MVRILQEPNLFLIVIEHFTFHAKYDANSTFTKELHAHCMIISCWLCTTALIPSCLLGSEPKEKHKNAVRNRCEPKITYQRVLPLVNFTQISNRSPSCRKRNMRYTSVTF